MLLVILMIVVTWIGLSVNEAERRKADKDLNEPELLRKYGPDWRILCGR